jgi:biopolymer transport protein ExbB/TolQ
MAANKPKAVAMSASAIPGATITHLELGDKQAHAERAYRLMNTEANSEIDRLDSNLSILAMIAA